MREEQREVFLPRPQLAQGTEKEPAEQGEREGAVLAEHPAEPLAESKEAAHGAASEGRDADEVKPLERPDHRRVGAEQHEDERPADAGQDHGADGDGAGGEEKQRGVALHERRQSGQPPRNARPDQQQDGGGRAAVLPPDFAEHERHTGGDQPKEERPQQHGVGLQQVVQEPGEQRHRRHDARPEGGEEPEVVVAPRFHGSLPEKVANGADSQIADGGQEFLVDADDERDRAPTDARNEVRCAHGHATQAERPPLLRGAGCHQATSRLESMCAAQACAPPLRL